MANNRPNTNRDERNLSRPAFLKSLFSGRLGRLGYLVSGFILTIGLIVAGGIFNGILHDFENPVGRVVLAAFFLAIIILLCVVAVSVCVRRLHDMNYSGWFAVFLPFFIIALAVPIFIVPGALGNLVLLLAPGTKDANKYGPPPNESRRTPTASNEEAHYNYWRPNNTQNPAPPANAGLAAKTGKNTQAINKPRRQTSQYSAPGSVDDPVYNPSRDYRG